MIHKNNTGISKFFVFVLQVGEGSHWGQRQHACGYTQRARPLRGAGIKEVAV